jgi:hypothetical protein
MRASALLALCGLVGCSGGDVIPPPSDAGPARTRDAGPCPANQIRNSRGNCECTNDNGCESGEICDDGLCSSGCRHHGHCADDERCERSQCVPLCPPGEICDDRCSVDGDCADEQHCLNGLCVDDCTRHSQCADDEACETSSGRCVALGGDRCRDAAQCSGRATCEDATCICDAAAAYSTVRVEDLTDNGGLRQGDSLRVTVNLVHDDHGVQMGLILRWRNLSGVNLNAAENHMLSADGGWQNLDDGSKGLPLTLTGPRPTVTFSGRVGNGDEPVWLQSKLVMLGRGPCAIEVPESTGQALLGLVGGSANPSQTCLDLLGTRVIQLATGQTEQATSAWANSGSQRSDLARAGSSDPIAGYSLRTCLRGANGPPILLSSDSAGIAPVATAGQLLIEAYRPWGVEPCERTSDCGVNEVCIRDANDALTCRERLSTGVAGIAAVPLTDRDNGNRAVPTLNPAPCLGACRVEPLGQTGHNTWGAADLDLAPFLPRTRDTDLRLSVIETGETLGWSPLFAMPWGLPDWQTYAVCACAADGTVDCTADRPAGTIAGRGVCSEQ